MSFRAPNLPLDSAGRRSMVSGSTREKKKRLRHTRLRTAIRKDGSCQRRNADRQTGKALLLCRPSTAPLLGASRHLAHKFQRDRRMEGG